MKRNSSVILAAVLASTLVACSQEPANDSADMTPAAEASEAMATNPDLDQKVMVALEECKRIEPSCGEGNPAGYFVFPDVTSVALGVGGAGGDGALVQNGQVVEYYRMGEGSIGLQAGINAASYVFEVSDAQALEQYTRDGEWSIGAEAGVTVAQANADAQAQAGNAGSVVYVFNSEGLMGDASINAMKIWRTDEVTDGSAMNDAMESTTTPAT